MYIERVPNRGSVPAVLLRESYRDGDRIRKRTLANLTALPAEQVEALRAVLKGQLVVPTSDHSFEIIRSRPHGHVAAVVGTIRRLGLEEMLHPTPSRERDLVVAMIAARVLNPASKLSTARGLDRETLSSTLAEILELGDVNADALYCAMDWLLPQQEAIEKGLAKRHLADGSLLLYDVTSTYFEGKHCGLARRGYSRDGQPGTLQIVIGLLCDVRGRPIAIEVFEGNTADPATVAAQVAKVRDRFALKRVVFVGDRGMITGARIREDVQPAEFDWITSLRAPAIRKLAESGALQLSLFDQKDLAEISDPSFPGERLVVCRNPLLAADRARTRQELLAATESLLEEVAGATQRAKRPLRGEARIAQRVGAVLGRHKMAKHFQVEVSETRLAYSRREQIIQSEAALDGIYAIRTSVPAGALNAEQVVSAYKGLSEVERAFRTLKTTDLRIRPIHHWRSHRVRSHVLICMLAYYVEWHMRDALAPLLFKDEDPDAGQRARESVVKPAVRSAGAETKAETKRTLDESMAVESFRDLMRDLSTLAKNRVRPGGASAIEFDKITRPTPLQAKALELLQVSALV